jgi:hypothetical protein
MNGGSYETGYSSGGLQVGVRGENCWNEETSYSGFRQWDRTFSVSARTVPPAAHESLGVRT